VFPSGSLEPPPFSVTVCPTLTAWSGPAFDTGGRFEAGAAVTTTVSAVLLTVPSLTVSCTV
jgi:hypothetical protein